MGKELLVAFTQIVQTIFSISVFSEPVLGTFPMTSEAESAFPALTGKGGALVASELLLALAIEHGCEGLLEDVS